VALKPLGGKFCLRRRMGGLRFRPDPVTRGRFSW